MGGGFTAGSVALLCFFRLEDLLRGLHLRLFLPGAGTLVPHIRLLLSLRDA
jgi:hypothetical protein